MLTILSGQLITEHSMYAPLLVFFTGVWIFIHFNRTVQRIDAHAVAVPRAIFLYSFQFIGTIVAILAGLSLLASLFSITKIKSGHSISFAVTLIRASDDVPAERTQFPNRFLNRCSAVKLRI
jgi:hypothetical protein